MHPLSCLMTAMNWTPTKLAAECDCTAGNIGAILDGRVKRSNKVIDGLVKYFGLTMDEAHRFLGLTDQAEISAMVERMKANAASRLQNAAR